MRLEGIFAASFCTQSVNLIGLPSNAEGALQITTDQRPDSANSEHEGQGYNASGPTK